MLLHPRTCCRQPQFASVYSLTNSFSFISLYLSLRTHTSTRKSRPTLQASQPASVALNPPSTTHPPPLTLPEKLPALPIYKYYFRVGKAYGVFYKNGLKAIWANYKLAQALPHRIFSRGQAKVHQAVRDGFLSRADFQLIRRTRRDVNKVPLFALIWLICGEFTPLVVIYFTGAVPRTIWMPKQVQKAREEAENRRAKSKDAGVVVFAGPSWQSDIEAMPEEAQRKVLKSYANFLGLYPVWVRIFPRSPFLSYMKSCRKESLGSKRALLIMALVLQLHFLCRIRRADSEVCIVGSLDSDITG